MLKKVLVHTRRSIKIIVLMAVALSIAIGIVASFYKVSYSVNINGEIVGHTDNKSKLQSQINNYIDAEDDENTAFIQLDSLPEYNICLLKRTESANDEEIFAKIKSNGTSYYRYYAILDDQEEKLYVNTFAEAEEIVDKLKEKGSSNVANIAIAEKYETELREMTAIDDAVESLYVKPKAVVAKKSGSVNTNTTISGTKVALGINLAKPVSGILSSRFGERSSIRSSAHTGLDIATSRGTPIAAAASGTVTFSGWQGSYGRLVVVTHENGVQTYYGHCNTLYVSAGEKVVQGQTIATVGSTGNSTGPHLHFEVRVNGVAYNPQNYLY